MDGIFVSFTAKLTPLSNQEFQAGDDGSVTAASFKSMIDTYLAANGIASDYTATVINGNQVQIDSNVNGVTFGAVTIVNNDFFDEIDGTTAGNVQSSVDFTFGLPGDPLVLGDAYYNIEVDGTTLVADFSAAGAEDNLEIWVNGVPTATTQMNQFQMDGVTSSNYGYPTTGTFRPASPRTGDFYIGTLSGVIPNRVAEFQAITGLNLPLATVTYQSNVSATAQQRIWVENLLTTDQVEIRVTGKDYPSGGTGWGVNVRLISTIGGDITLASQNP